MWALGLALVVAGGRIARRQSLAPSVAVAVVETEVVRDVVREVPARPILSVQIASPRSAIGAVPAPCPPADVAIDRAVGARFDPAGDDAPAVPATEVIAAPSRPQLIAARDGAGRIHLSRDDGRRFEPVLDGAGDLRDIAFGCAGELYALRGAGRSLRIGVRGAGGDRWRPVRLGACQDDDVEAELELRTGGGWVALVIHHREYCADSARDQLWLSPDGGASWRQLEVPTTAMFEGFSLLDVRTDRVRIAVYEGDCMYDGTVLEDLDVGTGAVTRSSPLSRDFQMRTLETRGRWGYGLRGCDGVCRVRLDGPPTSEYDDSPRWTLIVPEVDTDLNPRLFSGPRHLYAFDGSRFHAVSSGSARLLAPQPAAASYDAVDAAGRLLGVSERGRVLRWSPLHGTRVLGPISR